MVDSNPLNLLINLSSQFFDILRDFGQGLTLPLIPDVPVVRELIQFLETLNYFNPYWAFVKYMLDIDSLFDITVLHFFTISLSLVLGLKFVKWLFDFVT